MLHDLGAKTMQHSLEDANVAIMLRMIDGGDFNDPHPFIFT